MSQRHVVIKLGSSIVLNTEGYLETARIHRLIEQIKTIQTSGYTVSLVISGAVAVGKRFIQQSKESDDVFKQMAASIGQVRLMADLQEIFFQQHVHAAQLLLTKEDLRLKKKKTNIKNILNAAHNARMVFIINENDAVELNNFGGNDYLACKIASLINADYLLLLTDVEGVYSIDKTILKEIAPHSFHTMGSFTNNKKVGGTGSMIAKVKAASEAAGFDINTFIMSGHTANALSRLIINKEHIGTKVLA